MNAELPDGRPSYPLEHLLELPDGRRAEWEASGAGTPMLWIEGGPGLPAHLARPDVALVADRFRAHLVNAPGCGRSSTPTTADGYGLDAHVRYFDDVRRALGLGAVTVMGHSWGGLVALALAVAVPEAVERLVIIDGTPARRPSPRMSPRPNGIERSTGSARNLGSSPLSRPSPEDWTSPRGSSTSDSRTAGRSISRIPRARPRARTSPASVARLGGTSRPHGRGAQSPRSTSGRGSIRFGAQPS